ncbi:hypothetical protein [Haloflavibacter putidus]|uniref:Lipocalin-like domain-containing protein n=1 Tax=Haloflavibacter putidus TaxID=2576776 RepID=A0A508A191_9FLAO|nr:hypothetical protein [Haloflavibacter putidus]TQD40705.1 hypothetical protein FKR84_01620 [Haloflavibacter putidus]
MKKIMLMAVAIVTVTLMSCSSDDDSTQAAPNSSELAGSWELTDFHYNGETTTTMAGQSFTTTYDAQGQDFDNAVVTFNEDNTYTSSGSYDIEITMNTMGQETTQTSTLNDVYGSGTWEVDGNTLITQDSSMEQESQATMQMLDANTLKLTVPNYTQAMPDLPNGAEMEVDIAAEMTLVRQ